MCVTHYKMLAEKFKDFMNAEFAKYLKNVLHTQSWVSSLPLFLKQYYLKIFCRISVPLEGY